MVPLKALTSSTSSVELDKLPNMGARVPFSVLELAWNFTTLVYPISVGIVRNSKGLRSYCAVDTRWKDSLPFRC